jgi:hypothetical protein
MQNFVISKTIYKTEIEEVATTLPRKNFSWYKLSAVAAVILILFGLLYLIPNTKDAIPKQDTEVAKITEPENLSSIQKQNWELVKPPSKIVTESRPEKQSHSVVQTKEKNSVVEPNHNLEQILATMTDKELADLGYKNDQDVYLDLYD